jgi:hypothetical protein
MEAIAALRAAASARAMRGARGAGFRLASAESAAPEAAGAASVGGVSLLAAQEAGAAAERDSRGRKRAVHMLEELARLQADLLSGRADPAALARLAELAAGEPPEDPELAEICAAVSLRARIELARRGR